MRARGGGCTRLYEPKRQGPAAMPEVLGVTVLCLPVIRRGPVHTTVIIFCLISSKGWGIPIRLSRRKAARCSSGDRRQHTLSSVGLRAARESYTYRKEKPNSFAKRKCTDDCQRPKTY